MKKNYELVQVNVISLENEDVITASGTKPSLFGGIFDFGSGEGYNNNTQIFS